MLAPADDRFDQDLAIFERLLEVPPLAELPPREEPDLPEARLLELPERLGLPREAGIVRGNNIHQRSDPGC